MQTGTPLHKMLPNLKRTAEALDAYDKFDADYNERVVRLTNEQAYAEHERLLELELEVGKAYAKDTADRNPPDVAYLIKPGSKVPPPGFEQSFVRRMVQIWREGR